MAGRVQLDGAPVVITGAGSGIGRATAIACAHQGMPVACAGRREEPLDAVVEKIRRKGGRAVAVLCDVRHDADVERLVARAKENHGPAHAVFANAGYGAEFAMHEKDAIQRTREMLEVNFYGALRLVREALPGMLERGSGHALWCASCLANLPAPYYAAYCVSKSAQRHAARAMRLELAHRNVAVSTVCPVGTRTAFLDNAAAQSGGRLRVAGASDRFTQTPERVARAVVRCLRKPRAEVWTSTLGRVGLGIATAAPETTDRAVGWLLRKRLAQENNTHAGNA